MSFNIAEIVRMTTGRTLNGWSMMDWNGEEGAVKKISSLISQKKDSFNSKNHALYEAAYYNYPKIIQCLLECGANANYQYLNSHVICHNKRSITNQTKSSLDLSLGQTPLFYACQRGNLECIKILLQYQANPDLTTIEGDSPFSIALSHNNLVCALYLANNGCNVHLSSKKKWTPFMSLIEICCRWFNSCYQYQEQDQLTVHTLLADLRSKNTGQQVCSANLKKNTEFRVGTIRQEILIAQREQFKKNLKTKHDLAYLILQIMFKQGLQINWGTEETKYLVSYQRYAKLYYSGIDNKSSIRKYWLTINYKFLSLIKDWSPFLFLLWQSGQEWSPETHPTLLPEERQAAIFYLFFRKKKSPTNTRLDDKLWRNVFSYLIPRFN